MTDQPKQDAIVSQRAAASAQALQTYLSIRGLKDGEIFRAFARFEAEIEAATIERCAGVVEAFEGTASMERCDDPLAAAGCAIGEAIRNLKGQTS